MLVICVPPRLSSRLPIQNPSISKLDTNFSCFPKLSLNNDHCAPSLLFWWRQHFVFNQHRQFFSSKAMKKNYWEGGQPAETLEIYNCSKYVQSKEEATRCSLAHSHLNKHWCWRESNDWIHSEDTWVEMGSYLHIYHLCSPVFILNSCQGSHRRNKHPCTKSKRYREGALNINHLSKMVDYRSMVDNIDPVATLHCGEYLSGFFFQN